MAMIGFLLRLVMAGGLFDADVVSHRRAWSSGQICCAIVRAAISNAHLHGCAAMRLHMDGNDGLLTPLKRPEHS